MIKIIIFHLVIAMNLKKTSKRLKNVFLYVLTAIERYIILICMIIIIYGTINFMIII